MTTFINRLRKSQLHGSGLNAWNFRGKPDFTSFDPDMILAGDNWQCNTPGDGVVVNNVAGNVVMYQGDLLIATVDNPGALTHENVNNGNWEIMRKHPIGLGTKKSYVHGGYLFEASIDNDYHYLCVQAGVPETLNGSADGTAIWKKSPLHISI